MIDPVKDVVPEAVEFFGDDLDALVLDFDVKGIPEEAYGKRLFKTQAPGRVIGRVIQFSGSGLDFGCSFLADLSLMIKGPCYCSYRNIAYFSNIVQIGHI
jgi:hypothetical protein